LLIQTTSDANFEERFNSLNFKAEQNKTAFDKVGEKKAKSQTEPCNSFNFEDKSIYFCYLSSSYCSNIFHKFSLDIFFFYQVIASVNVVTMKLSYAAQYFWK